MSDQLPSWLSFIVALPGSILAVIQLWEWRQRRRYRRRLRVSYTQKRGVERVRIDVTEDIQL